MYVRRRIRLICFIADSWRSLAIVLAWSAVAVVLHEVLSLTMLAMPVLPVSVLGTAVTLYLGFKSKLAYERWWEARQAVGTLVSSSRTWAMQVNSLIPHAEQDAWPALR